MDIRVGFGYDVHQLVKNRDLWLGGINIPADKGSLGHSDGDALIHAICDALLGAAALPDIGRQFPDTDANLKDIDSKILLKKTCELIRKEGFEIGNVDSTIVLQKPKIASNVPEMKKTLAKVMGVKPGQISVKATTTEHMGFEGREEGLSAYAVVLIKRNSLK
ncbi:MAG: 2-C-methyl-D-erythritol 2,4-cyclodiphosphate synthase [Bacteroidales bacterium]|nr:2-C-methyl-D-erythritol 2,4-cyclodiphosphate synthase [Bacteroidales bacterium]MCF8343301.1 2-C-methyl-D-erythritol 2,4-cyclodiphosphate synthase [Bacteroidales bacterium]MCF8349869.1 2-C-methyl-D-erythritol 2,4-cyclodiphosphate synthase [Bacteroidales bacterium]MCF8375535.1 2-C-methyl-D-erythritol 2,4-cyclodiphosphate synthase [Bacteroidales bacterium]MCF8399934.1 2-C-methyl-D-erythritol 2,4-cyclodiphosphate synthase [Bacteroidales bacterium]